MTRLPRDAALPALAALLEPRRMLATLADSRSDQDLCCDIERIKYRPNRNCVVSYRIGRPGYAPRRMAVCMYPRNEIGRRYRKGQGIEPRIRLLPELNAIAWPFPGDRKLQSLHLLCDADHARAQWLDALVRQHHPAHSLQSVATEVASFFPLHSATVRTQLGLVDPSGSPGCWVVYGQVRAGDGATRVYTALRHLWAHSCRTRMAPYTARPLLHDADRQVLWQEEICAPNLADQLGQGFAVDWAAVAAVLARLHASHIDLPEERSFLQLSHALEGAARTVMSALPDHAAAVKALQRRLQRTAPGRPAPSTVVHGDLHGRNLLCSGTRAWLIDFDRVAIGDPCGDVGTLAAELVNHDCSAGHPIDWSRMESLLDAYTDASPWSIDARSLRWHVAAALLRGRVHRAVTSLSAGAIATVPRLLAAANRMLE